jgi:aminoglycoside 6'-N-acetyltransferase
MVEQLYRFRPLDLTDLPLLQRWFGEAHVRTWWDDPDNGLAEIEQAMRDPGTEPFIVLWGNRPIGYQQSYDPHAEHDHPYRDQPLGTRGIDQFIGEPDLIGRGHGPRFIREFVDGLFARGAPRVVTDPDPANARALRAYMKAGFRMLEPRHTIFGRVMLMACDRPSPHSEVRDT